MHPSDTPTVSIIIATYNWSSALALAIRSVLHQTLTDFELLVVGDHCTDDTADIVAAFTDPRISFFNLPRNIGSQWGPNNEGLRHARGRFVAYLGHDDLWLPDHLGAMVATAQDREAEIVTSLGIVYGPRGSQLRGAIGFFTNGIYGPRDVLIPGSVMHRRDLVEKAGLWRDAHHIKRATDVDFMWRLVDAGNRVASSNKMTLLKFMTVWRKNAYDLRDVTDQSEMLARMQREPEFRETELADLVRASVEGRGIPMAWPLRDRTFYNDGLTASNLLYKGAREAIELDPPPVLTGRQRFAAELFGRFPDWHGLERHPLLGPFRWAGPHHVSHADLRVAFDRPMAVAVHILWFAHGDPARDLSIRINGRPVPFTAQRTREGTFLLTFTATPPEKPESGLASDMVSIAFSVSQTRQLRDFQPVEDMRWVSLALAWIELAPADPAGPA